VRCSLNENGSAGVVTEAATTDADIFSTAMDHNVIAASALSGSTIRLYGSQLTHNVVSVSGNVLSHGNNAVVNNTFNNLPTLLPAPTQQ